MSPQQAEDIAIRLLDFWANEYRKALLISDVRERAYAIYLCDLEMMKRGKLCPMTAEEACSFG